MPGRRPPGAGGLFHYLHLGQNLDFVDRVDFVVCVLFLFAIYINMYMNTRINKESLYYFWFLGSLDVVFPVPFANPRNWAAVAWCQREVHTHMLGRCSPELIG